ncbi:MAG TPA: lactonase family protein [Candidatus Blautia faecipullorum]|nr:lactonase family protein [Candidatus Blautia faecipullorum]
MGNKKYVAYVGTYTHGSSKGIRVYDVDVEKGLLTERSEVKVSNASHTAVSKNGKFLYSIEDEGVAVFERNADGDLKRINSVNIDGMRGCFLATDVDGKYLYVAGYHDGKVTVVHTHKDGRLGSLMDGVFHTGLGSVAERNFRPHVNCVRPTPDNKYLCAVDNGIDQVKIYRINKRRHKLELVDILRCPRESGPRIIRFSADGRFAYLLFELSNEIKVYSYDGSGNVPEFELLQSVSTLAKEHDKDAFHNAASGLALAPDGKHLFCTTAGENTVSMYEIDPETGLLDKKFTLPISGDYPKDLVIFPDNQHIALANHASNTITTFTVDYEKNLIIMNGKPHKIETPNCIHIWPVPEDTETEETEETEE